MKLRFLLFFILVFFLGAFSTKAQDLVYNGEVEIIIKINKISIYDLHDHNGNTEPHVKFWRDDIALKDFTDGIPRDRKYWIDYEHDLLPGYKIYSKKIEIKNQTLVQYFTDNKVDFEMECWEHDRGGSNVEQNAIFSLKSLLSEASSPGYHSKKIITTKGAFAIPHYRAELEYFITPPSIAITSPSADATSFEEGSIVPLKVNEPVGANFEYEWMVQIDGATIEENIYGDHVSSDFIMMFEMMSGEEFPWAKIFGSNIPDYRREELSQDDLIEITEYFQLQFERGMYSGAIRDEFNRSLVSNTRTLPYFVPAIDSKTKSYITKEATCDYLLPESNKFYRNFKFRVRTIVRTAGKADLRCIEEDKIVIIDVFPHYPKIQPINEGDKKTVTCFGGSDGELKVKVVGDLGTNGGVVAYRATVQKIDGTYSDSKTFDTSEFTFYNLKEGDYELTVSNGFNPSNTVNYESKDKTNYNGFFLLGHETVPFAIKQKDKIELEKDAQFISNNKCDQYVVDLANITTKGGLGGYKYSLDNDNISTKPRVLADALELPGYGEGKDIPLYIEDVAGCIGQGTAVLTRDLKFEFIVADENLPIISCFGETTNFQVSAQGGSGTYQFDLDKEIDSNSPISNELIDVEVNAGKHVFYAKESHGCSSNIERTFEQNEAVEIYNFERTKKVIGKEIHISCNGGNDGEIKFKIKGGTPTYSYTLTGPTLKSDTDIILGAEVVIEGLKAGDYTLTILDKNGCSLGEDKTFKLEEPSIVQVNPTYLNYSGYNYKCFGDVETIELQVMGGISPYVLNYDGTKKNISNSGDVAEFDVQGTAPNIIINDALGCIPDFDFTLIEPAELSLNLSRNNYTSGSGEVYHIKQFGGTDKLDVIVEGGITPYNIKLLKDDIEIDSKQSENGDCLFTGVKAGTYKVTVTGKYLGCSETTVITLKEPDPLIAAVRLPTKLNNYDIKCHGDDARISVTPSGGIKPYVIEITGDKMLSKTVNSSIKTDFNLKAGSYILSIKDEHNSPKEIKRFTLKEPKTLGLNVESMLNFEGEYQIKCFEGKGEVKVTPSGGVSDYKLIQDIDGILSIRDEINEFQSFSNLDAGLYNYQITDANGCNETANIELKKPNLLELHDPVFKIPSCHKKDMGDKFLKGDGEIKVNATGGCDAVYYTFSLRNHMDGTVTNLSGKTIDFIGLKTGIYDIEVTDANGCFAEKIDQNLKEPELLFLHDVVSIAPKCHKESNGSWTSKIIGGAGEIFNYSIDGATDITTGRTFNQLGKKAGSYEVRITDEKGCLYKQNIVVAKKDSIVNSMNIAGIDILKGGKEIKFKCFGEDTLTSFFVNGGNPAYSVMVKKNGASFHTFTKVANDTKITFPADKKLGSGSYTFLTVDEKGCESAEVKFNLDQPVQFSFAKSDPKYKNHLEEEFDYTCFGASELLGVQIAGGTAPYVIAYNAETKNVTKSEDYIDFTVSSKKPIFIVKDANDCPASYEPTLKEPLELQLELSSNIYESNIPEEYHIKCFGATDSIWAKATGGITPYTFELLDESNTLLTSKESNDEVFFEDLVTGLYHVKVTGAYNNSCSDFHNISLKQPEPINSNITLSKYNGFEIKCNGLTDTIKVEAFGGISPYAIHLKGMGIKKNFTEVDEEQVIFSDLPAGEYQVSITDQFKACEYVKDIVLREPTALNFDIETSHYEGGFEIRCSYLRDSVRIIPYGGIPITNSSKYKIVQSDEDENHQLGNAIAGDDLVFKNLGAGMYSYIVSDENKCFVENVVQLTKPDSLQITGIDFTIPTCHEKDMGDISKRTDGEILVKAIGGVGFAEGYDFLLNKLPLSDAKDRLDSIRAISNATFVQRETGEYIIRVADVNACITERGKQHLEQADWLHIEGFNSVIPECYEAKDGFWESEVLGGTSSSGNYSFIISKEEQAFRNGTTAMAFNQDDLGKGKYLLEITDDLGCYYKQEEELLQPAEMAIDFDVMGVTDYGNNDGAVQARVSGGNGGYSYQWYHKGEKFANGEHKKIEELYAGEYTVEVWDQNNCPYGNNEFGIANGLKKTASVIEPGSKLNIVVNPFKTSYFGAADGVLEVSAVGGWPYAVWPGYEFSLNQGAWLVTSNFENLKAGLYQLRVKDSKGVKDSIEVVIEEPEEILMEFEKSNCLCFEDASGSIRVNASGGTAPYTYAIDYAIDFIKLNEFTGLKAGNYRIFVKDRLGNIQSKYIDIEEPKVLNVELVNLENSTCNSSNGSVKIEITGGTLEYYVSWGDFYPTNTLYPKTLAAGNYQVEVTDANSCVASQSFSIEEKSGPEISLKNLKEVSCHESTDGEISIEINNGTAPYDVIWNGLESLNSSEIKQLGKGKYSLVVSDANNCFAEAEYEITGPEELELYVSSLQSPNCVGINDGSILMTAVGGSPEYIYNINGSSNSTGWFPNLGAEGLQIEVTDANACKKTLEAELSAPVSVTIELPYEYVLCKNQTEIVSSGVNGVLSEWFFGENQFSTNNEVELSEEGEYRLVVTTEKGCKVEHEFTISFLDYEVVADFIIPVEAIVGDTIVAVDISWELPDSVKWHFPDAFEVVKRAEASIWLRVLEAGNHTIGMSIFKNECSDYLEKQVSVEGSSTKRKAGFIQPEQVYITEAKLYPNPNRGDFYLKLFLNKVEDVRLEIYDVQRALKIDTQEGQNNAVYEFYFNNKSIFRPNNVYAIVIIVGNEKRVLRFLVY